jgi:hypothetical protein
MTVGEVGEAGDAGDSGDEGEAIEVVDDSDATEAGELGDVGEVGEVGDCGIVAGGEVDCGETRGEKRVRAASTACGVNGCGCGGDAVAPGENEVGEGIVDASSVLSLVVVRRCVEEEVSSNLTADSDSDGQKCGGGAFED